jgi:predicted metal-dependent hydrolase
VLKEWYRQKLKEKIPTLMAKWQPIIGVEVNEWHIKQMKTRWGSCKIEAKRIWLNLELAKKSPLCLEYIIVHELVHLLERHHNKRFNSLMDRFMPQWEFHQKELNDWLSFNQWDY